MEPVLAILIGIGLAAACGIRIFVPFLVISVAANSGHLALLLDLNGLALRLRLQLQHLIQ